MNADSNPENWTYMVRSSHRRVARALDAALVGTRSPMRARDTDVVQSDDDRDALHQLIRQNRILRDQDTGLIGWVVNPPNKKQRIQDVLDAKPGATYYVGDIAYVSGYYGGDVIKVAEETPDKYEVLAATESLPTRIRVLRKGDYA